MGISQQIATFAIKTRRALIPENARNIARLSLIDWIAVAIAGRDEPVSRIVRQMLIDEGGSPQANIIGSRVKLSARAATLCNGKILMHSIMTIRTLYILVIQTLPTYQPQWRWLKKLALVRSMILLMIV